MIFDAEDLAKVLEPLLLEAMRRGNFEASMMAQQRNVRYIGPKEDVVALYQGGQLNGEEMNFYRDRVMLELERRAAEASAEATGRNYHKIDPEEAKRVYGIPSEAMETLGAARGKGEPGA